MYITIKLFTTLSVHYFEMVITVWIVGLFLEHGSLNPTPLLVGLKMVVVKANINGGERRI